MMSANLPGNSTSRNDSINCCMSGDELGGVTFSAWQLEGRVVELRRGVATPECSEMGVVCTSQLHTR